VRRGKVMYKKERQMKEEPNEKDENKKTGRLRADVGTKEKEESVEGEVAFSRMQLGCENGESGN
jgi:hypothetical protein